jgi:outer membrane protein OmpA-like peptidoglycan-associated protein
MTTRLDDTWMNWSSPVNLGKPINTGALDFYFTIDRAGNIFTSRANKALDGGQLDLYMLVPKTIKIHLVGMVYDEKTMDPLSASVTVGVKDVDPMVLQADASGKFETTLSDVASYQVATDFSGYLPNKQSFTLPELNNDTTINLEILLQRVAKTLIVRGNVYDKKTEQLLTANVEMTRRGDARSAQKLVAADGRYEKEVPALGWYMLTASTSGYLNSTDSIEADDNSRSPFVRDLYLQRIEVGLTVRLKNIYFDFDKTTLKKESFAELDRVVDFLKRNESVAIEIAGHTDNKGSDDYNSNLSQGRSQSVVDYLTSQGIDSGRLSAHGYGESKPIDTNDSDGGRANNRRVEFTILKT